MRSIINLKAVAIDINLLVVLRGIDLLLNPTPSRDHMHVVLLSINIEKLSKLSASMQLMIGSL